MSKSIEAIREALAAGPTPGEWHSDDTAVFLCGEGGFDLYHCPNPHINAAFIAACNPAAIAELLAELDAALSRASEVEADAARYRWLKHAARSVDWSSWIRLSKGQKCQAYRVCTRITPDDMDDEIDAAIRSMRPTGDSGVQS